VQKVSRRDLPLAVASGADGATTVSATMLLAARAGVRVFVTGGIGGVHRRVAASAGLLPQSQPHCGPAQGEAAGRPGQPARPCKCGSNTHHLCRGGESSMDVSADLTELGRTPVAVICAGAKSVSPQSADCQRWCGAMIVP
jgi:pseudouridine-5'-phosphate glycosidase